MSKVWIATIKYNISEKIALENDIEKSRVGIKKESSIETLDGPDRTLDAVLEIPKEYQCNT